MQCAICEKSISPRQRKEHLDTEHNLDPTLIEWIQRVYHRVNASLKDSNAKKFMMYELRLDVLMPYSALPKKYRNVHQCPYTFLALKTFKINSEIRDLDIIYEKLQKYSLDSPRDRIIEVLKVTRTTGLEHPKVLGISLKKTD